MGMEQTNTQTDKPVGDLARTPLLSKFRNKGLNQNSVETLYAGNVGHHYTKISENWIKNCRRSSILRDPSEKWGFSFTVPPLGKKTVKVRGIAVCKQPSPLRELMCHMGSHSVTCHPAEVTFPPLPRLIKAVLDSATPEGCKAELT